jgi:hypothetical protein
MTTKCCYMGDTEELLTKTFKSKALEQYFVHQQTEPSAVLLTKIYVRRRSYEHCWICFLYFPSNSYIEG